MNQTDVLTTPVPLISKAESAVLLQYLDSRISEITYLEEVIDDAIDRSGVLRQSILKRAFEGKLVPQDSNDEPASVLLERIRAEQGHVPKSRRRRKKGRGMSSKEAV